VLAGHGADLGKMAVDGIAQLAPTATLLLFAVLYFALMIDAGLFDPLVNRVLRFAGEDPVRVALGTAIVALIVALDGDGATTALITITAFLPVYRRLGMNPLVLAVILGSANTVMNLAPWAAPAARRRRCTSIRRTSSCPCCPRSRRAFWARWRLPGTWAGANAAGSRAAPTRSNPANRSFRSPAT
jgi:Mg2+/citrate symporter